MIHLLRLYVPSFTPRDALKGPAWDMEVSQKREEEDHREGLPQAFFEAVWSALRSYFGEGALPDLAAIEAAKRGDMRPYWDWDHSISDEINPDLGTFLHAIHVESFWFLYLEVDHDGGDHTDLALLQENRLELFFRHGADRDDSDMLAGLFLPLREACEARELAPTQIELEVTFVDEQGIHASPFAAFLEQRGLS